MSMCYMHNPGEQPPAEYEMGLPIGNVIPLCAPCCAWWRADVADKPEDDLSKPLWIRSIR